MGRITEKSLSHIFDETDPKFTGSSYLLTPNQNLELLAKIKAKAKAKAKNEEIDNIPNDEKPDYVVTNIYKSKQQVVYDRNAHNLKPIGYVIPRDVIERFVEEFDTIIRDIYLDKGLHITNMED